MFFRSNVTYGFSESSSSQQRSSLNFCNSNHTGDRLKPPPDAINFEHKKIRLNSKSSNSPELEKIQIKKLKKVDNSGTNGDVLDNIIIKDRRKEEDKPSNNKGIGETKLQGSDSGSSGNKIIKLKRTHITTNNEVSIFSEILHILCQSCGSRLQVSHLCVMGQITQPDMVYLMKEKPGKVN